MGDDRFMGQGMRRRNGGRPSNYHDDWYPSTLPPESFRAQHGETFETYDSGDLVRAIEAGEPGAHEEMERRRQYTPGYASRGIRGSDGSTGAS